jgi:hypothetical protein
VPPTTRGVLAAVLAVLTLPSDFARFNLLAVLRLLTLPSDFARFIAVRIMCMEASTSIAHR